MDAAAILCQTLGLLIRFPLMLLDAVLDGKGEKKWMNVFIETSSGFSTRMIQLHK